MNMFNNSKKELDSSKLVSYKISLMLAKSLKSFSDGEICKNAISYASELISNEKEKILFKNIALSRNTITKRNENMKNNLVSNLKIIEKSLFFSICIDESTDITGYAQLAIFARVCNKNLEIEEIFLGIYALTDTTTGKDIYLKLIQILDFFQFDFKKMSGIVSDGARSMVGSINGANELLFNEFCKRGGNSTNFVKIHCIIHNENLCSQVLKLEDVMNFVVSTINYIRSNGNNHRQFQEFLKIIE